MMKRANAFERGSMHTIQDNNRKISRVIPVLGAAAVVTAVVLVGIVWYLISLYKESLLAEETRQMEYLVASVTNSIEVYVEQYEKDLYLTAQNSAFLDDEKDVLAGDESGMTAYFTAQTDIRGQDLGGICYSSPDGFQVGTCDGYTLVKEMGSSTQSGLSCDLVKTGEKDFYLLISTETAGGGILSFLLDVREIYNKTASWITLGENGYIMLKSSDGLILSHPVEEQVGIYVISGRQELYPDFDLTDLSQMVEKQLAGETGYAMYSSYWWAQEDPEPVTKISAYQPAYVAEDFLVVSAVIDYSELTAPITEGMLRILVAGGLGGTLFLLLVVMLVLSFRSFMAAEAENERLQRLNRQLEELRVREERASHRERLQLLGAMSGGIAHEFNNLLTPIMGYSGMLLESCDPASENYEDIREIYDSAEKAKEVIEQLTQFSGKNAEKTFKNLQLISVIERALVMVRAAKPKHVDIQSNLTDRDTIICGNATQITQLILNLCNNAFAAMKDCENAVLEIVGGVCVPTGIEHPFFERKECAGKTFYKLTVVDNGLGMSPEVLEQIYVPFFTTKHSGEGTGLGLSIVQRIVETHGGTLVVKSTEGKGTAFSVYLPVIEAKQEMSLGFFQK